ncbi:MAG: gliding motility-associated C-terminal domain-containing protein, partial [Endomicrobia bacterium]|nr:gliding motility-associated C-terminal domain-containing protein [Endomicrobiia bacterium]
LFYSSNNKTSWEKIVLTSQQNIFSLTNLIDDSTYYWYVVAVDTYANTNVSDEFVFYTQYLNQPPSIPQILSPVDNEIVKLPYNILWSTATDFDIFDSVLYKIEISSMESFIPLLIEKTQSYTSFTLTREVPPGVYYLRILACDSFGGISTSTVVKFIVPYYTIQNYAPTNNSVITNLPIEFSFSQIDPVVINDTITYKIILSTYSNFMYKQEILLSNTYYYLSSPPLFPARYYWYVVALDSYGRSVESPVWNFLVPLVYPAAPKSVVVSTSVVGLVLSWEKINIENFWGYKVYRGYDIEDVNQLIFFSTFTSCIDEKGIVGDYFYTVKTVNQFGIESVDNIYIKVSQGKQLNFYISEDKNVIVSIIKDEDVDEIHIIRCQDEENDKIKYVYKILPSIDKTKIGNFYEINFGHLAKDKKYLVEYYDGYNWIEIPFSFQYNKLVVKTQYFGKYRVVEIEKVSQVKKLTILGCSPQKRIITPNNDGKNDYIEFQCDTNSYLDGEIYDIKLRKICKLKRKDKNVIYFDGYDDDGNLLPAGLYVYYISLKPSGETFSDTILIKY